MDKLKDVPQESQTNLLQEDKRDYSAITVKSQCNWMMTSGKLEGGLCDKGAFEKAYDGKKYCSAHLITMARKGAKEGVANSPGEEVTVTIKASDIDNPHSVTVVPLSVENIEKFPPKIDIDTKKKKKVKFESVVENISEDEEDARKIRDLVEISRNVVNDEYNNRVLKVIENFMTTIANLTELLKK